MNDLDQIFICRYFNPRKRKRAYLLTLFVCLVGVGGICARPEKACGQGPVVAVCDSPTVEKWLARIGVASQRRTGLGLGAEPISGVKLLILPLESVNTPGAVKNVRAFINGGGKVAAFYWGAMRPPGSTAAPIYDLCPSLGVRP